MCCGSCWRARQGFEIKRELDLTRIHLFCVRYSERSRAFEGRQSRRLFDNPLNEFASLPSGQLLTAYGSGIRSQRSYRVSNAQVVWFRQVCEFFLGSAQNKNFVVHLRALNLFDGLREWNGLIV